MTDIEIPDYITPAKTLTDMTLTAADLLAKAEASDLPAPGHITLFHSAQVMSFSFSSDQDSFQALARWAERFGGTPTGESHTTGDGQESVHTKLRFDYLGVDVEAYAFITVPTADPATT
jgi:hypothetical protein